MRVGPFHDSVTDLAPGDLTALERDWSEFSVTSIRSPNDPLFEPTYARLWREFGATGGMERRDVIVDRLTWDPRSERSDYAMLYELIVVRRNDEIVAVRDHTAAARRDAAPHVTVHLSHVVVEPPLRGSGLASWLRALPVGTAHRCAAAAGARATHVTLVAEMEHPDVRTPAVTARLRSYARAGFRMADPARIAYAQPDFRSAGEIERSENRPLPLVLVIRRVGREAEADMLAAELREHVRAVYAVYGVHVRADHMGPVLALLDGFPPDEERVKLLPPWQDDTAYGEARR